MPKCRYGCQCGRHHPRRDYSDISKSLDEKLWAKVNRRGPYCRKLKSRCHQWTGRPGPHGYGSVWHNRRYVRVHRLVYELLVGPIPSGYQIDHRCENKLCVNPKHLEATTPAINTRRYYERGGRGRWVHA